MHHLVTARANYSIYSSEHRIDARSQDPFLGNLAAPNQLGLHFGQYSLKLRLADAIVATRRNRVPLCRHNNRDASQTKRLSPTISILTPIKGRYFTIEDITFKVSVEFILTSFEPVFMLHHAA
jgi:hypothetical protein